MNANPNILCQVMHLRGDRHWTVLWNQSDIPNYTPGHDMVRDTVIELITRLNQDHKFVRVSEGTALMFNLMYEAFHQKNGFSTMILIRQYTIAQLTGVQRAIALSRHEHTSTVVTF